MESVSHISPTPSRSQGFKDHSSSRLKRAILFVREHGALEVLRRARKHGLKSSSAFVLRNIRHSIAAGASRRFDRKFGVDTAGSLQLQYLTIDSPNADLGTEAVSTSPKSFDWMLKAVERPLADFTYIDLGCGKGRTLLLASKYGFRKAIGVEFAAELVQIANRNCLTAHDGFPGGVSVIHEDASAFEFPEGPMVVFLYNPFGPKVCEKVLRNLASRLKNSRDECYVVYGSSMTDTISWFKPMIAETGVFEEVETQPMPLFWDAVRTIHYSVYRRKSRS